jgi:hypothetical protein
MSNSNKVYEKSLYHLFEKSFLQYFFNIKCRLAENTMASNFLELGSKIAVLFPYARFVELEAKKCF